MPPSDEIFAIELTPRVAKKVTTRIHRIPNNPTVYVDVRPNNDQVCVWSLPEINVDSGIQTLDEVDNIQIIHEDNQMKVPIKAHFSPIEPANQE